MILNQSIYKELLSFNYVQYNRFNNNMYYLVKYNNKILDIKLTQKELMYLINKNNIFNINFIDKIYIPIYTDRKTFHMKRICLYSNEMQIKSDE